MCPARLSNSHAASIWPVSSALAGDHFGGDDSQHQ